MKSNLRKSLGSEAAKLNKNQPVCPKPRRPSPAIPEALKPLRCTKHRCSQQQPSNENKCGIIPGMLDEKIPSGEYERGCTSCSPTCYAGSPPKRTDNPLVQDVRFIHQMELLSPLSVRTSLTDKFTFTSRPASPI